MRERGGWKRRATAFAAVGASTMMVLGWGCSDDATGTAPGVDPGGTFGAEISLTVVGRGRVTTNIPGIDCPDSCFTKYIFSSATADGAAGSVSLVAEPTPGATFKGWRFDTGPLGASGRGPDSCNPISRPATAAAVDAHAATIVLPYGQVAGSPPKGQEAACAAYTAVPIAYSITAEFDTGEPIADAGSDAGTGQVIFTAPNGAVSPAHDLGLDDSGFLYWLYGNPGAHGIAYGTNPQSASGPITGSSILDPVAATTVTVFKAERNGVTYATSLGSVFIVHLGAATMVSNGGQTCAALATDDERNVYCRTATSIIRWNYPGYLTPVTLYSSGVGSGSDLAIDSTLSELFFSTSTSISSLPVAAPDSGIATPEIIVSGQVFPTNLTLDSFGGHLWWIASGSVYASSSLAFGADGTLTGAAASKLAPDPLSTNMFWAATTTTITHAYYLGGALTQAFQSGLVGVGGVAADTRYVYWTQSDGKVRRAPP